MEEVQVPLPAGTAIYEHYIVESLLGIGDFGSVYLVRDRRDEQKRFALAELLNWTVDASYRFALNYVSRVPLDRHVLPRKQYFHRDNTLGRAYLLMNYIEEPNLEMLRLQRAEQRFPLSQVSSIMTPVVNAIHHLHQHNPPIIHGNLNPACIIVSQSIDGPVLLMLDLFKEHDAITTPLHYFAPGYGASEQYDEQCSVRTDIYGLGATYYTLLTGLIPPDALYRITQQKHGETDPLQPAHEVNPDVPVSIAEVIRQAMSLNPDQRFSSVEQLHSEIATLAEESPIAPSAQQDATTTLQSSIAALAEESPADIVPDTPAIAPFSPVPATPGPQEPASSQAEARDTVRSSASDRVDKAKAPTPVPEKQPAARRVRMRALFIGLAILLIVGVGADFWFHVQSLPPVHTSTPAPTVTRPSPSPTATPVPSPYPTLAGSYKGTIYDVSVNVSTVISLTGIRQNQDQISGYLTLGPSIQGSGPFKGIIDYTKRFQFIVTDVAGNSRLFFEGVMQSPTTLTGDYYDCNPGSPSQDSRCIRASGSYGIWNVILA